MRLQYPNTHEGLHSSTLHKLSLLDKHITKHPYTRLQCGEPPRPTFPFHYHKVSSRRDQRLATCNALLLQPPSRPSNGQFRKIPILALGFHSLGPHGIVVKRVISMKVQNMGYEI